jgi:hypothetical protein
LAAIAIAKGYTFAVPSVIPDFAGRKRLQKVIAKVIDGSRLIGYARRMPQMAVFAIKDARLDSRLWR